MILADKIIKERKKLGMSQEELAEEMNVSRQAVSKWEGNQSVPEIEKILQLSRLFGVTTDYLLKDEIESNEELGKPGSAKENEAAKEDSAVKEEPQREAAAELPAREGAGQAPPTIIVEKYGFFPFGKKTVTIPSNEVVSVNEEQAVKTVTMEQAEFYLGMRRKAAKKIAAGTLLCIASIVPMLTLLEMNYLHGNLLGIAVALILAITAAAVCLLVDTGFKNSPYEFLEKEPFETEEGVTEMVKQRQEAFSVTYSKFNMIGIVLCIVSPIPLIMGAISEYRRAIAVGLVFMAVMVGIGAFFLILAGVPHESMQKLLKEGDYSNEAKKLKPIKRTIAAVYWLVVTAVYFCVFFFSGGHGGISRSGSWAIWIVAGVLFPAVMAIGGLLGKNIGKK